MGFIFKNNHKNFTSTVANTEKNLNYIPLFP